MRLAAAAAAAAVLTGCAQGMQRPAPEELKIGETTQAEVMERMGRRTPVLGTLERNGRTLQIVAYAQDAEWERPHGYDGIIPGRTQLFYFLDGRLVGHEFNSTVEQDHTDFSPRPTRDIVRGRTTREEVVKLLGRPSGVLAFPLVESPGGAVLFAYRESRRVPFGKPAVFSKALVIHFDSNGIVNDFTYTTSGIP